MFNNNRRLLNKIIRINNNNIIKLSNNKNNIIINNELIKLQKRNIWTPMDSILWFAYKPKDRADTPPPGVDPMFWQNRMFMRARGLSNYGWIGHLRFIAKEATSSPMSIIFWGTWIVSVALMYRAYSDPDTFYKMSSQSTTYNLAAKKEEERVNILKNRGGHGHGESWEAH